MKISISLYRKIAILNYLNDEIEILKQDDNILLKYRDSGITVDPTLNDVYIQICEKFNFNAVNDKYLHNQVRKIINLVKNQKYIEGSYSFQNFINIPDINYIQKQTKIHNQTKINKNKMLRI